MDRIMSREDMQFEVLKVLRSCEELMALYRELAKEDGHLPSPEVQEKYGQLHRGTYAAISEWRRRAYRHQDARRMLGKEPVVVRFQWFKKAGAALARAVGHVLGAIFFVGCILYMLVVVVILFVKYEQGLVERLRELRDLREL